MSKRGENKSKHTPPSSTKACAPDSARTARTRPSQRDFLRDGGSLALAALALSDSGAADASGKESAAAPSDETAFNGRSRSERAYRVRLEAARRQRELPLKRHSANGDEQAYEQKWGSFTKGLPHDRHGEVDGGAYRALLRALRTGRHEDFESVPMGASAKLVNPQAAHAFVLEGSDPQLPHIKTPPTLSSAEEAAEMVELYRQALARDVPFNEYDDNALTHAAADELSRLTSFQGPRAGGGVTTATLFRGGAVGDLVGPYVSQFLWQDVNHGSIPFAQRLALPPPGSDYMHGYDEWLAAQNGAPPKPARYEGPRLYIRTGRDLAEYVHRDFTYQAFLNACLILLGTGAPQDPRLPYRNSRTQSGFGTFGEPYVLDLVAKVACHGLKAAWFQKWFVHRRLRPEEFAGCVQRKRTGGAPPVHADVLDSRALEAVFQKHGTYLLPQAYPEGCPLHPAFPAGHAVIAGACATVLKAFFDESFVMRAPVAPSRDGLSLVPYGGAGLTVGGELNKLASNIAVGRNVAGVHWRSDAAEGLRLGESIAVSVMTDMKRCFHESFEGVSLTTFDGRATTV